jgi:hypothetical protein
MEAVGRAVVVGADGTEGLARVLAVTVRAVLVLVDGMEALEAAMAAVAGAMDLEAVAGAVAATSRVPVGLPSVSSPS